MPASRSSFAVTDAYRDRTLTIRRSAEAACRAMWSRFRQPDPDGQVDLDGGYERWLAAMVPAVMAAQGQAVRASHGYLTAFLSSELREPAAAERGDGRYLGVSRDGRPLRDALGSPLIGVKVELKAGKSLERALRIGLNRAVRLVGMEVDHATRGALRDGLIAEPRIAGYRRAVRGTCGACLGAASGTFSDAADFETHPGCQCVAEPKLRGVLDRFPRPDGQMIFAAMTAAEQAKAVGPEAAELVRAGDIALADLVKRAKQIAAPDFLTQKPNRALA